MHPKFWVGLDFDVLCKAWKFHTPAWTTALTATQKRAFFVSFRKWVLKYYCSPSTIHFSIALKKGRQARTKCDIKQYSMPGSKRKVCARQTQKKHNKNWPWILNCVPSTYLCFSFFLVQLWWKIQNLPDHGAPLFLNQLTSNQLQSGPFAHIYQPWNPGKIISNWVALRGGISQKYSGSSYFGTNTECKWHHTPSLTYKGEAEMVHRWKTLNFPKKFSIFTLSKTLNLKWFTLIQATVTLKSGSFIGETLNNIVP